MRASLNYTGRYQNLCASWGCLYLNNSGTKWVTKDMRFYLKIKDKMKLRLADYFEQFGNFSLVVYRYKEKQYKKFCDGYNPSDNIGIINHTD